MLYEDGESTGQKYAQSVTPAPSTQHPARGRARQVRLNLKKIIPLYWTKINLIILFVELKGLSSLICKMTCNISGIFKDMLGKPNGQFNALFGVSPDNGFSIPRGVRGVGFWS